MEILYRCQAPQQKPSPTRSSPKLNRNLTHLNRHPMHFPQKPLQFSPKINSFRLLQYFAQQANTIFSIDAESLKLLPVVEEG